MSSNPNVGCDRVRFHPEHMKLVLDEMVREAGVKTVFLADIRKVENTGGEVRLTLDNRYEEQEICGKVLIDATGNSEAVYLMDPEATEKTEKGKQQGVTMIFTIGNVDHEAFQQNLDPESLSEIIRQGQEDGVFPYRIFASCPLPGTNSVSISMTRVADVDVEKIQDISEALMEARKQIDKAVPYLREHLKGCENAYLSCIAPALGIRERRRIVGLYELKGEELIHCVSFPDTVALGCYPVDIHRKCGEHAVQFIPIEGTGIYEIPYRSMIARDYPNVLAGGKNIYADDVAFAAMRTMPSVMGVGSAAGNAAAMAAETGADLREIELTRLRKHIQNVDFPDSKEHFGAK